jgi:DNA repair protein RadA/Sms
MAKKTGIHFVCQECGQTYAKWQGHCDGCGQWNTIVEEIAKIIPSIKTHSAHPNPQDFICSLAQSTKLTQDFSRFSTGIGELDRCLGSDIQGAVGMVQGSVVLIGGEPGIGKSTLLTQVVLNRCHQMPQKRLLYVCGEESPSQINLRIARLLPPNETLAHLALDYIMTTDVDVIVELLTKSQPSLLIVDSVQTLTTQELHGQAGSLGQVKECTERLTKLAKNQSIPTFLVGHVTKDGDIAGPKILEHLVDAILELSGERSGDLRFLRTLKNRFGPTDEVGVFRMNEIGMIEVSNPSEYFLQTAQKKIPGSGVVCLLEGTRPLLTEVQALVVASQLAMPRRVGRGIDLSRVQVLSAVLQKHCRLPLGVSDIFLSVVGGMKVQESGIDLGLAVALASSLQEKPLPDRAVFIGEVGLMGEIRPVSAYDRRVKESQRLGYRQVYSFKSHHNVRELLQNLRLI